MEQNVVIGVFAVLAYLLGSIPSAVWYGKTFHQIDVREHGSKNAGATNTLRVLGNKAGFTVLFFDLLKGFVATDLAYFALTDTTDLNLLFKLKMLYGVIAVLGHVYPVFAQFRGGKGIATLLGLAIALDYRIAGICVASFISIVWITRYISVGSMLSGIAAAVLSFYFYQSNLFANIFFCAIAVMVVYTHRTNIKRLMSGTENKLSFKKKS